MLSSFGGYGVSGFDVVAARLPRDVRRRAHASGDDDATRRRRRLASIRSAEAALYGSGLALRGSRRRRATSSPPSRATASSSECIANDTAILYTSRGHFVEYEVLVAEMPRYLRCGFIDHDDLFAGRWQEALDRMLAQPAPLEKPATNGAEVMAGMISSMISIA